MSTITNNKLTDERPDDEGLELLITIRREIAERHASEGRMEQCAVHTLILNALLELQERRKADSAPPAQIVSIPDDWQTCEKLSDDSYVDNALRELVEDTTGDNGVRVVQAVIRALRDSGLIRTYPDLSQPVDPQISEYEKIMLQAGNSPVIPDGYTLVPVEPTDEMIAAAMNCEDVLFNSDESFCVQFGNIYEAMLAAAPQPEANNE